MLKHVTLLVIIGVHVALGFSADWDAWIRWRLEHGKTYTSLDEEHSHMTTWLDNYKLVTDHNSRTDVGYKLHLNHLADQKLQRSPIPVTINSLDLSSNTILFAPESWDWRSKGAVGPVQDQGMLGDAQAIVASECVDSYHFIHIGEMVRTSAGEAHDCCTPTPLASTVIFQCIHQIGGLCSQDSYPSPTGKCGNDTCSPVATVKGNGMVPSGNEATLKDAVYQVPVMAAIDASHVSFQLYSSGIYSEPQCSAKRLDHVIQVVGYGTEGGQDYWICKNSWGASWGEQGYIKIARNKGNMCGIASMATYPV